MFEATVLLILFGLILWFTLPRTRTSYSQRTPFINLTAELKPPAKKQTSAIVPESRLSPVHPQGNHKASFSKRIKPA